MNVKKKMKEYGFDTMCSDCGMPIKRKQLAIELSEVYATDYDQREEICIPLNLCSECLKRIKANNEGGMKRAIKKYEKAMVIESSMKEAFDRRNKP